MSPDLQISTETSVSIHPFVTAPITVNRTKKKHPADLQQVLLLLAELNRLHVSAE